MENYQGIKFETLQLATTFSFDQRLAELNYWISLMSDLGLAPVHPEGAYGNHSYRKDLNSFIITRTGMIPQKDLQAADYCCIHYQEEEERFHVMGSHEPSSESFLHNLLYQNNPKIQAIMHGHCDLLTQHAEDLGIAITAVEHPYGTMELATSALSLCRHTQSFFILKNHGFVATGASIAQTGRTVLKHYSRLIDFLLKRSDSSAT